MTKTDSLVYKITVTKVECFKKSNFGKYAILDYIDGVINQVRKSELCSDELLRHLFDIRQKVLLGKNI